MSTRARSALGAGLLVRTSSRVPRREAGYLNEIRRGHYAAASRVLQGRSFEFRIESDLVAVVAETKYAYGTRAWLKFEYLTPLPFSVVDRSFSVTGGRGGLDHDFIRNGRRWRRC